MTIKALAIDLDGTLLVGEDLPEENRLALAAAADAGYRVILATARWRQLAERVQSEVGINEPLIACSGAQVYLPATGIDLYDARLPDDFIKELTALCDSHRCIATMTVDDHTLLKLAGEPDKRHVPEEMTWVPQLAGNLNAAPRIATTQGTELNALIKSDLKPRFKETVNIFDSMGPSGKLVLTITAKQADKGAALLATCEHLKISPEEVLAFGDAENDLAMFAVAGAAVAMGNASDDIKGLADHVTLRNDEAGVAAAVNQLLEGSLTLSGNRS